MKPPPFLLGAALLFWGWQSGLLIPGAIMAGVLEGARFTKARWELSDRDLSRIWTFCSLLTLAAVVFAFTENDGPANFSNFFQNPSGATRSDAGTSTAHTSAALFRWLPMLLFLFVAAQTYNTRETFPLVAISMILRRRWRLAKERGQTTPADWPVAVGYPYFAVCLLAAGVHKEPETGRFDTFFWGLCALLAWALWVQRSRRFGFAIWAAALLLAMGLGFAGQRGLGEVLGLVQRLNVQWLARLMRQSSDAEQSRTALGQIGELKQSPRIVVRLELPDDRPPPEYLRETSYRMYGAEIWRAGAGTNGFEPVPETPQDSAIWPLLPGKTNLATLRIATYLDGWKQGSRAALLPLPRTSGRLESLRAFTVEKNPNGAVLATGPGLVIFDAHYGPGAALDAPADPNEDLLVPSREAPAIAKIAAELGLDGNDLKGSLRKLTEFFGDTNRFRYSTWQGRFRPAGTNETPLSRFLLKTHRGHCEYFATATVLLLRQAGIPARYVVGYAVHEGAGRKYVVRQRDAHAWCLVWNAARGQWQDFDTTPASWVVEETRASPFLWLADAWSRVRYEIARVWWGQSNLRQYVLWSLGPLLALLLYQIIFRRGRKRRGGDSAKVESPTVWPGLDSEFYLLERALAERGVPRAASEPLSEWLERAAEAVNSVALKASLAELLRLHYRYRFDPAGLSEDDRAVLRERAGACLTAMTTSVRSRPPG